MSKLSEMRTGIAEVKEKFMSLAERARRTAGVAVVAGGLAITLTACANGGEASSNDKESLPNEILGGFVGDSDEPPTTPQTLAPLPNKDPPIDCGPPTSWKGPEDVVITERQWYASQIEQNPGEVSPEDIRVAVVACDEPAANIPNAQVGYHGAIENVGNLCLLYGHGTGAYAPDSAWWQTTEVACDITAGIAGG